MYMLYKDLSGFGDATQTTSPLLPRHNYMVTDSIPHGVESHTRSDSISLGGLKRCDWNCFCSVQLCQRCSNILDKEDHKILTKVKSVDKNSLKERFASVTMKKRDEM